MRIVQAVVLVAPPVLILWMGGTYLLDCGRLLLAPMVPVAFDYRSPDGVVKVWADGYRIEPDRRTASLWGLSARRSNGRPIATVEKVDVSGLDPFRLRPDVRIRGVRARLERDAKGLDLARLLPKKEGPPSTIPYAVTVEDARLEFLDRTFRKPVRQVVQTDRLAFDGVGEDWRAQGDVRLPGIGKADVRAQSLGNAGITLDLQTDVLRLEKIATTLVPGLRATKLTAYGPVRVDVPKGGKFRVATTMRATALGLVYQQYRVDEASFQGRASELGLEGVIAARVGDARARFEGSATREAGGGRVVATVPSPNSIPAWARRYLPPKVGFRNARYEGWAAWRGKTPTLDGQASVARATYGSDVVDDVRARVAYSGRGVDVRDLSARWQGAPLVGDASFDPKTKAVRGAVLAPRVQLAALARRLGRPDLGVSGTVGGQALVSGTLEKPQVEGRVDGRVALKGRDLGSVEARGAWLAGAARVDRLRVSGPLGAIVAGGTVRPDGTLALRAEARGLRLERLAPDVKGLVSANLNVGGTLRNPKADGRIEAYRIEAGGQRLPAAGLDLVADKTRIELRRIAAVRGTARLRGRVAASLVGKGVVLTDPRTWLLDGRLALNGVQANEIPGTDRVGDLAGILSIPEAQLSGRLGDPVLDAQVQADGLIVRGIRMESLQASVRADRRGARLTDLEADGAGGRLTAKGDFDFAKRNGDIDLALADVQLSRLLTDVSEDILVDGTVSAPQVRLAVRNGKPFGQAEGILRGVTVNGVLAGDGNWRLDASGEKVTAVASVGRLDPTLRAIDATAVYNVAEGSLAANVQAKDLPLQALVIAATAKRATSESEAARLATVAGDLSGSVEVVRLADGTLRVDASDLRAAAIRYLDVDYGTLTLASVQRRGARWTVGGARLDGAAGSFAMDGWLEEDGDLNVQTSGESVKVAAFAPFEPTLAQITGLSRFSLSATGTVRSPIVTGSAGIDGLFAEGDREALNVSLDRIDVRDGRSSVAGTIRYGSAFGGLFTATAGWGYRDPIKTASLEAKVDLGALSPLDPLDPSKGLQVNSVALAEVPGLGAYIDAKRTTDAFLTGSFSASGLIGKPNLAGGITLQASKLGITIPGEANRPITRVDDTLQNLKATLAFDKRNAPRLDLSTDFERGGTLTAMATLGDLKGESVFEALNRIRDWKPLPVEAFVEIPDAKKVVFRQGVAGGVTQGALVGRMDVSGEALKPYVQGGFELSNLETSLPSFTEGAGGGSKPILDPTFDLTLALANEGKPSPGRFRTATADLYLVGDASLKGSLSNPRLSAEFVTDRGSIRLPGGVVRVDRGGQISFLYKPALAAGAASATISLQGRSQVTVARQGFGSQRYDVTLDINGDLLRENGLKFEATSDPSDLTQNEILNALGGTQYLEGLSQGGSSTERNVRNAFAGFALPGLLDPITGGFGRLLGLDYLSLEYNEYDQATVAFARSLPYGFSFQGRQQVGTPTPGYRSIYDLRLSFSPRVVSKKFSSRLTFSLGTDQDRPWKTSVEYGTRFGQRGGKPSEKHNLFPKGK